MEEEEERGRRGDVGGEGEEEEGECRRRGCGEGSEERVEARREGKRRELILINDPQALCRFSQRLKLIRIDSGSLSN